MNPLCFVLMPFGIKTDGNNKEINFDTVYNSFIKPAIIEAGLEPIRADEETEGGFIHKPMYERLMFCDFAIADLSFANANVFYELGIRHSLRPHTTLSIFEVGTKIPFDTAPLRTFPYEYDDGAVKDVANKKTALTKLIKAKRQSLSNDSPIKELVEGYEFPDLQGLAKDAASFKAVMDDAKNQKEEIKEQVTKWKAVNIRLKEKGITDEQQKKIKDECKPFVTNTVAIQKRDKNDLRINYDLLYALIAAYKSMSAFQELADMLKPLVENNSDTNQLKENVYVKQQLGLAYNKVKNRDASEEILQSITGRYGPDPETNGLLGAVYKGRMDDAEKSGEEDLRDAYGLQAAAAYLEGFEADPRDFYPGVNAVTLFFLSDGRNNQSFLKYLPLVKYAVERALRTKSKDYWVQATALEVAVLELNIAEANKYYANALTCKPDDWMKETTAGNLKKIYTKELQAGDEQTLQWLKDIILRLNPAAFS